MGIRKGARPFDEAAGDCLLPPRDFHLVVERERGRSDRNGDPFSLLVFAATGEKTARATMLRLAEILRHRLRITDQAGWLDGGRIAVVLPSTLPHGARVLANDIVATFPKDRVPPVCDVHRYPGEEPDETVSADVDDVAEWAGSDASAGAGEALFVRRMPAWKRGTDIAVASIALVLLVPAFMLIAALVKLSSPGPAFFQQWRTGRGGRRFVLYKFRSMAVDADARKDEIRELNEQDGPAFKIRHDPRVTAIGRFLRKTGLDELPQLWNVLRGDMSLVGPRPLPCEETAECEGWHLQRLDVTPGLTCFWQTSDRTSVSFNDWMRMDVRYMRSQSFWQDARLILATAVVMLRGNRW